MRARNLQKKPEEAEKSKYPAFGFVKEYKKLLENKMSYARALI
jgi:hypothetical protein